MRAAYMIKPRVIEVRDVPIPTPGPGEVLVKVKAVGVCGTDFGYWKGKEPCMKEGALRKKYFKAGDKDKIGSDEFWNDFGGIVLGHEPSGTIAAVGEGVVGVSEGDRVLGQPVENCNEHYHSDGIQCLQGCKDSRFFGSSEDGVFRQFYTAKANQVHTLPDEMDLLCAAPLADAFSTPWRALTERAKVEDGMKVAVIGVGGVGAPTVELASKMGAYVIAIDINPYKLEVAESCGAAEVHNPQEDKGLVKTILKSTKGGVDRVMEVTGNADMQSFAVNILKSKGRVVWVGYSGEETSIRGGPVMFKDLEIFGSLGCGPTLYHRMINFVQEKNIDLKKFGTKIIKLDDLQAEFENWGTENSIRTIVDMDL